MEESARSNNPEGEDRRQVSLASNCGWPSTCGAMSVEGDSTEQQRRAAWVWARREETITGARERAEDNVSAEEVERD